MKRKDYEKELLKLQAELTTAPAGTAIGSALSGPYYGYRYATPYYGGGYNNLYSYSPGVGVGWRGVGWRGGALGYRGVGWRRLA
jgi:hypothetical protein